MQLTLNHFHEDRKRAKLYCITELLVDKTVRDYWKHSSKISRAWEPYSGIPTQRDSVGKKQLWHESRSRQIPIFKSYGNPKSMNKLTLNEPAKMVTFHNRCDLGDTMTTVTSSTWYYIVPNKKHISDTVRF